MNALELQGLTKHYKDFTLGPLDLTLPGGTICGLIGENGAAVPAKNGHGAAVPLHHV